jgi:hypothetical protein
VDGAPELTTSHAARPSRGKGLEDAGGFGDLGGLRWMVAQPVCKGREPHALGMQLPGIPRARVIGRTPKGRNDRRRPWAIRLRPHGRRGAERLRLPLVGRGGRSGGGPGTAGRPVVQVGATVQAKTCVRREAAVGKRRGWCALASEKLKTLGRNIYGLG